jgi:hypothetical protein
MTQQATTAPASADATIRQLDAGLRQMTDAQTRLDGGRTRLEQLEAKAAQLRLKVADLDARKNLVREQRERATNAERTKLDKAWMDAQHDFNVAQSELQLTSTQIQHQQEYLTMPAALAGPPATSDFPIGVTIAPPQMDPFKEAQIRGIEIGGFVLMIPIVLAFARRIWVRSGPRTASFDFDASPRLQRMEQAIESIALEVERIGEAQRFTTKLLAERQPDAAARLAPTPRREPGIITPH